MAQRKEIVKKDTINHTPRTIDDMERIAEKFAQSSLVPSAYRGKPADCFIIITTGADLDLTPSQSFRVLGSINGIPFVYGDGITALCQRHKDFEGMIEVESGNVEDFSFKVDCTMKRKGMPDITRSYSLSDAKKAGLLTKEPWIKHPKQMCHRRARSYCGKDQFADAIMGLLPEDEVMDITVIEEAIKPSGKGLGGLKEALGVIEQPIIEAEFKEEKTLLETLMELIIEKGVPDKTVEAWTKKANVNAIDEMDDQQLIKCIDYLKTKERKNGFSTANGTTDKGIEPSGTGHIQVSSTEVRSENLA